MVCGLTRHVLNEYEYVCMCVCVLWVHDESQERLVGREVSSSDAASIATFTSLSFVTPRMYVYKIYVCVAHKHRQNITSTSHFTIRPNYILC